MSRVKGGMTTRRKHKSILKQVKGHRELAVLGSEQLKNL